MTTYTEDFTEIAELHEEFKKRIAELERWFHGYRTPELSMIAMIDHIAELNKRIKYLENVCESQQLANESLAKMIDEEFGDA